MPDLPVQHKIVIDEHKLLDQVAEKNNLAFKRLYDLHVKRVYNVCLSMLGNNEDAQDVAQEVFFTLWKKSKSIRRESKLSTWLYRVAVNKSINFKKRGGLIGRIRGTMSLDSSNNEESIELPAPESSRPDRQYQMRKAKVTLANLMAKLPARQREAYLLHKLEGLSYQEVAAELGVSLSSVESAIHRAKLNLSKVAVKKFKRRASI